MIFMIRIVFSRTKSFSPKGITGFVLAARGKCIIGIIAQHLPETDFMSSKTIFLEVHRELLLLLDLFTFIAL